MSLTSDRCQYHLGDVKFVSGQLNGNKSDFNLVYDHLMEVRDLPSRNAAKRYLNERGLTPHHVDSETIQFVPKGLHGKFPHVGAASDLRNQ